HLPLRDLRRRRGLPLPVGHRLRRARLRRHHAGRDVRLPRRHRPGHPLRLAQARPDLDVALDPDPRNNGSHGSDGSPDAHGGAGLAARAQTHAVRAQLGAALLALGVQLRAGLLRDRVHRHLDEPPRLHPVRRHPVRQRAAPGRPHDRLRYGHRQDGPGRQAPLRADARPEVRHLLRRLLQQRRPLLGLLLRHQRRRPDRARRRLRARLPAPPRGAAPRHHEAAGEDRRGEPRRPLRRGGLVTAFAAGPLEGRAEVTDSYGDTVVDVAPGDWIELLTHVRDALGYAFFDWLTGVDEPPDAFHVVAHVYNPDTRSRLLLRTAVPRDDPRLPTAVGVYRGADWHERETYEMFGVIFEG